MSGRTENSITEKDCIVGLVTYNNGDDLERTLQKFPHDFPFAVVVHVDGSTDGSDGCLERFPYTVIRTVPNRGVGKAIKNCIEYARQEGFKAIAIIPGNNKNHPEEIPRLFAPILAGTADYVQGSRYLAGMDDASRREHTPLFRLVMVKVHAFMFSVITGKWCTDALDGFRAYRTDIFDDPAINMHQEWLDTYEFETYLHYKVLKSKRWRFVEVATSKMYPEDKKTVLNLKGRKYSHIRPFVDWWRILRPLLYLMLGLRK
jgi:dolichol-phosphate mannosyltransferase